MSLLNDSYRVAKCVVQSLQMTLNCAKRFIGIWVTSDCVCSLLFFWCLWHRVCQSNRKMSETEINNEPSIDTHIAALSLHPSKTMHKICLVTSAVHNIPDGFNEPNGCSSLFKHLVKAFAKQQSTQVNGPCYHLHCCVAFHFIYHFIIQLVLMETHKLVRDSSTMPTNCVWIVYSIWKCALTRDIFSQKSKKKILQKISEREKKTRSTL